MLVYNEAQLIMLVFCIALSVFSLFYGFLELLCFEVMAYAYIF